MAKQLYFGRNELEGFMILNEPLEEILVEGRFLQSDFHDVGGCKDNEHMHWYRKILKTYDPKTGKALLSKQGSRRLIKNLETADKEYSNKDLCDSNIVYCMVRERNHQLS